MNIENIITPDNSIFHKFVQVGIVVKDMDATVALMEKAFGWKVYSWAETPKGTKFYRGEEEDFKVKMAFYRMNGVEIELLEPMEGRSVWQDYLDEHGPGIHHILFDVNDFEKAKECLESQGIKMAQTGPSARYDGCRWAYFDATETLGYYIEIFNPSEFGYECI